LSNILICVTVYIAYKVKDMEQVAESLSVSFVVSTIPNNPNCPHPRFALYKARNNVPDQQERRRRILEEQKQ